MDRFEAPLIASYVNRLNSLDGCWKPTRSAEDVFYERHAPRPLASVAFVSTVAVIGIAALTLGFVSS